MTALYPRVQSMLNKNTFWASSISILPIGCPGISQTRFRRPDDGIADVRPALKSFLQLSRCEVFVVFLGGPS